MKKKNTFYAIFFAAAFFCFNLPYALANSFDSSDESMTFKDFDASEMTVGDPAFTEQTQETAQLEIDPNAQASLNKIVNEVTSQKKLTGQEELTQAIKRAQGKLDSTAEDLSRKTAEEMSKSAESLREKTVNEALSKKGDVPSEWNELEDSVKQVQQNIVSTTEAVIETPIVTKDAETVHSEDLPVVKDIVETVKAEGEAASQTETSKEIQKSMVENAAVSNAVQELTPMPLESQVLPLDSDETSEETAAIRTSVNKLGPGEIEKLFQRDAYLTGKQRIQKMELLLRREAAATALGVNPHSLPLEAYPQFANSNFSGNNGNSSGH